MKEPGGTAMAQAEDLYAACVAIDWADQKHYWSLREAGSQRIEQGELDHTPEAVEEWVSGLSRRFGGRPLAVALEQKRGALLAMLSKYESLHLFPVHPLTLARYRQAWHPSGCKSDRGDADLLLEILCQHRDRLRRLEPDTPQTRQLQFQVENRRKLVDARTAQSNQLRHWLKLYYPQILEWFPDLDTVVAGRFVERWPNLAELQKARATTIEKFLRQHHVRNPDHIRQRIQDIGRAVPATHDPALIDAAQTMALVCIQQMAVLRSAICRLEQAIAQLASRHPDWEIFDSLPGAGAALAPRLMAVLGTRRERFASANELQCFAGIAPVKEASGNTAWVHVRWACSRFVRQTFHEWAACSIPQCEWARQYYHHQRAKNKSHHTAVRALAFKWMRILYRCWKDRQPYREDLYLTRVAERAVPLHLIKAVEMS
jgi:transposase